jgi:hypothetical protein
MKLAILCLCLVLLVCLSDKATAANRFWVAAATSAWSNTANWSNVSGGVGGFTVPGAGDAVTFDNSRNGNCTIDIPVSVLNITVNGYTGTIAQGTNTFSTVNNASFSTGTFAGGSSNITFGGNFTLAGTAFTSTSSVLEFDGNANFTSATFVHNNGTVRFNGTGGTTISGTNPTFFILEFVGNGFNYLLNSAGNIQVSQSLNLTGTSVYNFNTGAIDVSGDVNVTNTAAGCGGTGQINIVGTGVQNFTGSTVAGAGALPKLTINKVSGTLNLFNFPASSNDFTYSAGTVNAGASTYCFTDGNASPYTITGNMGLGNIEFIAQTNQTFTIANTIIAMGNMTMAGAGKITINTGNINVNGNLFLTNTSATGGGSGTLNIVGASNEIIDGTAIAISQNLLPFVIINKAGGILTLKGNISESQDWTYTTGTVDAGSFGSTVVFGGNGLNITSAGMSFYHVTVTGNTITLLNSLTVKGNLTITAGHIAPGANTINLSGNWNDYGAAGFASATSTVNMNGTTLQTITSPGGESFTNLTVNNSGVGIQLVNNVAVTTTLSMTNGNINLNGNALNLGLSVANNGSLVYVAGTMFGAGSFTRWFKTGVITNGSVTGLFPMGTATDYRPFFLAAPAAGPTSGGTISIAYNDATTNTSIPTYMDGAATIMVRKDLNWAVSTGNGLAGGAFNLDVQGTGFGLIGAVSDLRLTLANTVVGLPGINAGTTLNPQINRTGLTAGNLNNSFFIGSINSVNTPLPVTLISFSASVANGEVVLKWTTAEEINNDHFTILRSKDGLGWENIQKIQGAGTSGSSISYSTTDPSPFTGTSYYRLMQTDMDGKSTYSYIISVSIGGQPTEIIVYPNPATDQITIILPSSDKYEVNLVNINGQMVCTPLINNGTRLNLNVSRLNPGIYFIEISHNGNTETKKIMISR